MWRRFLNWCEQRRRRRERCVFVYWNGRHTVWGDPWAIYRQLFNDPEFRIGRTSDDPTDELRPALDYEEPHFSRAVAAARRAFQTVPYDPRRRIGLTDAETAALLFQFLLWLDDLVKKNAGSSISSPPTAPESSPGQACPEATTSPPSPAGSPCSASSSDAATSC